eukprot:11174505-Lingulodinium_polyedra.AAC.1
MVVDARSAQIAKSAVPQQWNAFPSAFLSSYRASVAQKRVQIRIPLLRRRAFPDSRTPRVDRRVVVDA